MMRQASLVNGKFLVFLSFILLSTTAGPLHANLRAPRRIDGVLSGALNLPLAGFVITLKPGRYTLTVSYKQKLFVEARRHGYFRHWPEKDVTGIDYLLYPIWSWPTADTFRFTVEIEVRRLR